jgi:hypothetical protein
VRLDEDELHFIVVNLLINPGDRVVIDGVPIGGQDGLSIKFVVASCLTAA